MDEVKIFLVKRRINGIRIGERLQVKTQNKINTLTEYKIRNTNNINPHSLTPVHSPTLFPK